MGQAAPKLDDGESAARLGPTGPKESKPTGGGRLVSLLSRFLKWGLALALLGVLALAALVLYYARDLPDFRSLKDYQPRQVSRLIAPDGSVVGEFFTERRTVIPIGEVPPLLKQAFVSAEDAHFFEHSGLDYPGILRAAIKTLLGHKQGGSTITQQVVKTFLLTPERTLARKVKEWVLARRIEKNLGKDEILYLYLNQISFGHQRFGVEEASRYFFGKSARQLSLGEAALLGGLPQSPERLSPLRHPEAAKHRQSYVLRQMAENGFISRESAEAEIRKPLALAPRPPELPGPYYAAEVRRQLVDRYGEERVMEGGLQIEVAMDPMLQRAADRAVRRGLLELDHRLGYRGPLAVLLPQALAAARPGLLERLQSPIPWRDPSRRPVAAWDLSHLSPELVAEGSEAIRRAAYVRALEADELYGAVVARVDDQALQAEVDLGLRMGALSFENARWARLQGQKNPPRKLSEVVSPGDVILVRVLSVPADKASRVPLALEQLPKVQGALVAVEPESRRVVALVGGYDFERSAFNRATQAHRQPGSAFKPFVYATALASGKFTPSSVLNDAPELIYDPFARKEWKPQNDEKDVFEGPMTLREALAKSKNTVSVRLIQAVGPQAVIEMAQRAGIRSPLPENFTLALGSGEVTPIELCNAYATFAARGRKADPLLILRIKDPSGTVLEEHAAVLEESISPAVSFLVTSLMQSVIDQGTGRRAQVLSRPVAGKTGTASESRDTWFSGFVPDLAATAWAGYDDHLPMWGESGARAALPMWVSFMQAAIESRPRLDFEQPPGVEMVRIDPATGLLAADGSPGRFEAFLEGTAPKEVAPPSGQMRPDQFFLDDPKGRR